MTYEEIVEAVRALPEAQQQALIHEIEDWRSDILIESRSDPKPRRSILELEGLGAEIWDGIDAQEYINELRREWDHRP